MPVNSNFDILKDFDDTIFRFELVPLNCNNTYYFYNELRLLIGLYQYIDVDSWSNESFRIFIDDIIKRKNYKFIYMIENKRREIWSYDAVQNKIILNIWSDPEHLLAQGYVKIDDDIVKKLEKLYDAINKFKSDILNDVFVKQNQYVINI